MIPLKLMLVFYLFSGRYETEILYVIRYPTEQACQQEASKHQHHAFDSYGTKYAQCVYEIVTKEAK